MNIDKLSVGKNIAIILRAILNTCGATQEEFASCVLLLTARPTLLKAVSAVTSSTTLVAKREA